MAVFTEMKAQTKRENRNRGCITPLKFYNGGVEPYGSAPPPRRVQPPTHGTPDTFSIRQKTCSLCVCSPPQHIRHWMSGS